jgi:hypothetical protein
MKTFLSIFLMVALSVGAYAQSTEQIIAEIEKRTQMIDHQIKSEYPDGFVKKARKTDQGMITAYWKEGKLLRMELLADWETVQLYSQYYYQDAQLIFASEKTYRPNENAQGMDSRQADLFYFHNGKLTQWTDATGTLMDISDEMNALTGEQVMKYAAELLISVDK